MKITMRLVAGLGVCGLVVYGAMTTVQLQELQARVQMLELKQAQVGRSLRTLAIEQESPGVRFLGQR